eukprot:357480-Chlamydomonas_euryale.AAC.5
MQQPSHPQRRGVCHPDLPAATTPLMSGKERLVENVFIAMRMLTSSVAWYHSPCVAAAAPPKRQSPSPCACRFRPSP